MFLLFHPEWIEIQKKNIKKIYESPRKWNIPDGSVRIRRTTKNVPFSPPPFPPPHPSFTLPLSSTLPTHLLAAARKLRRSRSFTFPLCPSLFPYSFMGLFVAFPRFIFVKSISHMLTYTIIWDKDKRCVLQSRKVHARVNVFCTLLLTIIKTFWMESIASCWYCLFHVVCLCIRSWRMCDIIRKLLPYQDEFANLTIYHVLLSLSIVCETFLIYEDFRYYMLDVIVRRLPNKGV